MANFIDFTAESALKPELANEFIQLVQSATPENLTKWFKEKCFDVPLAECRKLIDKKKELIQLDELPWPLGGRGGY